MRLASDGSTAKLAPANAINAFYNRCDPTDAAWAVARLCAEPIGRSPSRLIEPIERPEENGAA